MKKSRKIFARTWKAVKWIFIAFCIYLGSLFFWQQSLPAGWIERKIQAQLPERFIFQLGECSFGFHRGLCLKDIRIYDRERENPYVPMAQAEGIRFDVLKRKLTITGPFYDRLPDSYYEDGDYAYGPRSLMKTPPPPWDFRFPKIPFMKRFRLVIEHPDILGLRPERVTGDVRISPTRAEVGNILLAWPGKSSLPTKVTGYIYLDILEKRLKGECEGFATQAQIRPHLEILDIPVCLPYMDGFTDVRGPVAGFFGYDVDLDTGHTVLDLDLHPVLGCYNGVKMRRADGKLKVEVRYVTGDMLLEFTAGPLVAYDSDGRQLEGLLTVHRVNDRATVEIDAVSHLAFGDLLNVIGLLNDGTLDDLQCASAPVVTAKGVLAPTVERQAENDLAGRFEVRDATLFKVPLHDVQAEYRYAGDTIAFTNATARGVRGGELSGWAQLKVPEFDPEQSMAEVDIVYRHGSVEEVANWFDFDLGDRKGRLEGDFHCSGPMVSNMVECMNGYGKLRVEDGHIAQMKLFAGMTEALAEYVPGVASIVNQNTLSCEYTIEEGVFKTDNLLIEGSLFSISAQGDYDIAKDDLAFDVRLEFTRKDSILGQYLIRPILWPFAKLLLEFRVTGPIDSADWNYRGILDRVGL